MHHAVLQAALLAVIATICGCSDRKSPAPAAESTPGVQPTAQSPEASAKATPAPSAKAGTSVDSRAFASCAAETNVVKRLACFDALAKASGLAPETIATSAAAAGKWMTSTDTDPLTDKAVHYAMLSANEGKGRYGDPIVMTVRCQNARTEAYINWSTFLGSEGLDVTSRIDKEAAVTTRWSLSTDSKASFMPQVAATLQKFDGASTFVVNLTPYNESPITAIFDITGASEAFKDIRRDCKG